MSSEPDSRADDSGTASDTADSGTVSETQGRGRTRIRGVIIGVGLVALVAVSVLAGRLTGGGQEPAAAEQPDAAESAPAPEDSGGHDHDGEESGVNPWLVRPDGPIQEWSESVAYTDPEGNPFTIHVELAKPTEMGMCTLGPLASEYNRTVVLSIRNDGDQPAAGPRIGILDQRVGFAHGEMGCSWNHPADTDAVYEPGEANTFRGLLLTEPVDEDVVVVLRPDEELLRIPAAALADS